MNQALEHVRVAYPDFERLLTSCFQLERRSWDKVALKDKKMLPLGLHETDLS